MADPYAIIAAYPNAGEGFLKGMQQGQQLQQQQRIRDAMSALSGRNDPNALRSLYAADPKLGMEMETTIGKREDRQRADASRAALAAYITGSDPVTAGAAAPASAGAPPASPGMGDAAATAAALDPEKFITVAGKKSNITKTQLETSIKVHDAAMQILGGVHDDASLQSAKQEARTLYQQYGGDPSFIDQIPDTYDPQVIHDLELRGMDTSHQLNALAHENDVGSLITTRAANTAEHVRHDQVQESNVQRGQNISSTDRRRGQDLTNNRASQPKPAATRPATPSTVIGGIMAKQAAGQQLTPQEQQLYNDYRSTKKRGGGGAPARPQNRAEYNALPSGTLYIDPAGTVRKKP
jgi:hypothetical protein